MNLAALLLDPARERPEAIALRAGKTAWTYDALARSASSVAAELGAAGVHPGDPVAIVLGNEPAFVAVYLGALAAGAVAVPLNPSAPAAELERAIGLVGTSVSVGALEGAVALEALHGGGPSEVAAAAPVPRDEADVAVLLFTAGTAGAPKAAMLTHGNIVANIRQVLDHPGLCLLPTDVTLGVLPFSHVFGLDVVLGTTLAAGATVVLVEGFRARESLELVRDYAVTVLAGVPSMFAAWLELDAAAAPPGSFASVRLAISGAAPLPREVADGFARRFGVALHEGYGLTEASPIVTSSAVVAAPRIGSIGPPLPGVEVRLVDVDGADVVAGDPGEIWVRGPNVFPGYWHDVDATRRVLTPDGWLRTGDVAVADDDGYLSIVDRAKDLVIVSGFNVYPAEVEEVLREHPDVSDAAVVGVGDPRTGEALTAYVVPEPGRAPVPEALRLHVARHLARYKVPTTVEVVDELPRTLVGKVMRRALPGRA